jgi:hypothetical protein
MIAHQIEFPLAVAVCAWCKPKKRGTSVVALSHGICLRHLKKLKLEAQGLAGKRLTRGRVAALRQAEDTSGTLSLPY